MNDPKANNLMKKNILRYVIFLKINLIYIFFCSNHYTEQQIYEGVLLYKTHLNEKMN